MSAESYENGPERNEAAEVMRLDRLAEAWIMARHSADWYLGEATSAEWDDAYTAVEIALASAGVEGPEATP